MLNTLTAASFPAGCYASTCRDNARWSTNAVYGFRDMNVTRMGTDTFSGFSRGTTDTDLSGASSCRTPSTNSRNDANRVRASLHAAADFASHDTHKASNVTVCALNSCSTRDVVTANPDATGRIVPSETKSANNMLVYPGCENSATGNSTLPAEALSCSCDTRRSGRAGEYKRCNKLSNGDCSDSPHHNNGTTSTD
jgi:hypothetical protein